ncbi:hypothetical protein PCYB_092600 [Plasmodium cynomolgi strain B]|uniref:Sec16 Sec23-binding domain-containing protein n=1 Tax=Plasmodium cynomolgi (strain B) TaxID=1120755 RepID=K6UT69_PLACD|nr:hypothetical protein PCYB_092600 [Plasmodium cynomolgi strain B]GAB66474.1 hypothetical protein PCYB_092600 [Plasmodium cynomolgi strain B]
MEEHLFSYENIFRNKDLNIDEEIREKNQKEKGPPVEDSNVPPEGAGLEDGNPKDGNPKDGDPKEESPHGFAKNKLKSEPDEGGCSIQSGAADESKKGEKSQKAEKGDTCPGGEGRPSEADCKGDPVEAVEEASTEVANEANVANETNSAHVEDARGEGQDATVHTNSQTEPQSKKKIKNDLSSLFADSSSEVMGAGGEQASDNNEINFWFSGKGATPRGGADREADRESDREADGEANDEADGEVNDEADGEANDEADGEVGEKEQTHDNSLTTPLDNNPDGTTNVICKRGEDGGNCGIQNAPNGVDASFGDFNEEKQIRCDGGDVPDWTPQVSSSDLVGDVSHSGRGKNGPSEGGEDAPRGDAAGGDAVGGDTAGGDAAGGEATVGNSAGDAAPTALCFGTNGTFCYTRGRKVKCAPLICVMESGIRARSEGSSAAADPAPPPSNTPAKRSNTNGSRDKTLEEHVYAIKYFPGPFSRRTDKVDQKVINFLQGLIKINGEKYGRNVYEYTQKSCVYQYLLNVMRSPHLLDFNLKDVRVDRSGVKADGSEKQKRRNAVSYFVESSRRQEEGRTNKGERRTKKGDGPRSRNGYPSGRSDHANYCHDWSGDFLASENNPREESGDEDQQRRDSPSDAEETSELNNNITEMEKFEITGRESEKREYPGGGGDIHHDGDLYQGDNLTWRTGECGTNPYGKKEKEKAKEKATDKATDKATEAEKKRVLVHNQQYEFHDLVNPNFIKEFSKMGIKEKITRDDIYLEYYHLCIYNSEEAARLCVEKKLFKHFFLILKKYNDEKYRLMLSKYITHINNSMNDDTEMTDGMKNIFRIYNPSIHNYIVKESFVFLISLLNRESMTFEKNLLINYWYSFYVLIYHNFLFQFEENELNYEEYKDDILRFFSFLINQLYMHGRVTESQFLYLQLCGNPCVFKVCEVIEYLHRSNDDNFFYEDLIRQKIKYAFTLLELGVLDQAKRYIEIIYYYVDVIRSQKKKNYYLVHMYESLLSQAKYVLPSLRLQDRGIFHASWTASNEDLPEGGIYNYKVISPHRDLQHGGEAHASDNNITMTPFEAKNPSGFNTDHVGSTHQGGLTGKVSNTFGSNPTSPPHISAALTTNQNQHTERVGSYSHFSFAPPLHSVGTNADQSNIHHEVSNSGTSSTPLANAPYPTNDGNLFLSSYHPPQMVASGEGAEYTPVEGGITSYQQYNGAYQNGSAQQAPHYAAHQSAYPPSSNNYSAGGGMSYGGNTKPPAQSGKSGPHEVTDKKIHSEKKKEADEQNGENNMDLINIGKTFISGFFSNIKEKITKTEQAEEEEEENIFYYDYEKKRWREKGVTSDEEEERERRKMQHEMEMKNIAPPPQTENRSMTNKKNPLDITDVRSRYVDYFN